MQVTKNINFLLLCPLRQKLLSLDFCRHRFSGKKKSHGWCDFAPAATVADPRQGFSVNDSIVVTADILVLDEEVTFTRDGEANSSSAAATAGEVLSGKFTWEGSQFQPVQGDDQNTEADVPGIQCWGM